MEQSTYANSVAIAMSHMDIRLIFTAREPKLSIDGNIESEDRAEVARIAMSLPVAKRLNKMLTSFISDYEAANGEIFDLERIEAGSSEDA